MCARGWRRKGRRRCMPSLSRRDPVDAAQARRPHADRARAGSAGGDRPPARPMASRGLAATARSRERREGVSRARAARIAPPHRCTLRRDACGAARSTKCARLAARKLDPLLPAMKAHGVPWLIRHLNGEISLAEAARRRQERHAPLHQAAVHLGAASTAGLDLDGAGRRSATRPCAPSRAEA